MNVWTNATLILALVVGSTAEAQQRIRPSSKVLAAPKAIGLIGDGGARSVFVFDANTDTIIGQVNTGFGPTQCYGDSVITSDLGRAYVATLQGAIFVIDLTTSPPSLAPGENPFEITNFGLDLALSADDRFLLVAAGFTPQEVACVDLSTHTVVDQFGTLQDTVAVDIGPDGSVLIASDGLNRVRRLTIDGTGHFTNTGEFLVEDFATNVYSLGSIGLVNSWVPGRLRSFTVPALTPIETLTTAGTGITMVATADPARNRVYVRKDDAVQAYPFDTATGDFGTTPIWNVPASNIPNCFGVDRLTLHPDGSKLYNTGPRTVQVRDPETGAVLMLISHTAMRQPSTITVRGLGAELTGFLDVKPGSCPNSFNPGSHGVLPVALVGADELDVTLVDITTLRLARADGGGESVAPHEGPPGPHTEVADVATPFEGETCDCGKLAGDGIPDLDIKFDTDELVAALGLDQLAPGALVELVLSGELLDGTRFSAGDCVRLVPPGTPEGELVVTTLSRGWIQTSPLDLALDGGGFGSFVRNYPIGSHVTLLASELDDLPFVAWEIDGERQKLGERTLLYHVKGPRAELRAIYEPKRTLR